MKKIGIFCCLLFIIQSCITQENLYGNYQYRGTRYGFNEEYKLSVKKDSFNIFYKTQDASPSCTGRWRISKDTLYLKCNEETNLSYMLSNGYMNQRDFVLEIMGNKKLNLFKEKVILVKE